MKLLFDTNIFIYHFNGQLNDFGRELLEKGISGKGSYSVISKIELLGFNQSETDQQRARQFLANLTDAL